MFFVDFINTLKSFTVYANNSSVILYILKNGKGIRGTTDII